ncbi:MAG: hypothetical protein V2I76_02310 [Roseobacter sp.]|nr:hypothetical protein [Roseobacter sp.]
MTDHTKIPCQSFYILMLGARDLDADFAFVCEPITYATRGISSDQPEAWAKALIKIDGAETTTYLWSDLFEALQESPKELCAVIAAVTQHAKHGDPNPREPVLAALARPAENRLDVAGTVAAAFERIGDFSGAAAIKSAIQRVMTGQTQHIEDYDLFTMSNCIYESQHVGITTFDPLLEN